MRLDDMDGKLDRIEKQTHAAARPDNKKESATAPSPILKAQAPRRVGTNAPAKKRAAKQAQPNERTARKAKR
jgi:hypothetical protein